MKKSNRFLIEIFDWNNYNDQMNNLWEKIDYKYPQGMYWSYDSNFCSWSNTLLLLDSLLQNEKGIAKVIGKAQTMFFPKLDDEVPIEAEQRILFHYRVLPEYENNEEAVELLYNVIVKKALELRTEVQRGRKCKICTSCTPNEYFYIRQALEKGYKETSGCYLMSTKSETKFPELEYEIPGIVIKDISTELF